MRRRLAEPPGNPGAAQNCLGLLRLRLAMTMEGAGTQADRLFSGRVEFLLSAPQLKFLPDPTVPEIAFAGRSNVGKSSLLNALTGRRAIARASVTPGRTQELNFFEVGEAPTALRLVDMPGYGFAKAPVESLPPAKWWSGGNSLSGHI